MSHPLPRLSPLAAGFCAATRFWPSERGKSFLLRTLDRLDPPRPEAVEIGLENGLRLEVFWNDVPSRTTALFGENDADLWRFLSFLYDRAARAKAVSPRFVDAGANLGLYSLRLARRGVRCEAFEPQARMVGLLSRNAARNGLAERLTVHPVALGAAEGEVFLEAMEENSCIARVGDGTKGVPVPLRRLDGEISPERWREVVAMKVDVEGFEIDVFRGASALFSLHRPPLVFELNMVECEARNHPPKLFREVLEGFGYRHFYALDRRLYPIGNGVFVVPNIVALAPGDEGLRDAFGFDPAFRPVPRPEWPVYDIEF